MNAAASAVPGTSAGIDQAQYLTFMLGGQAFALRILSVKEIIEFGKLTVVPMMPACIRGVINLRGAVLPVMDLQARFGRPPAAVTRHTCIVIVESQVNEERRDMGVIVDAVNAVVEIPAADIEPAPAFGTGMSTDFVKGMGKVNGRFVILLNADATLAAPDPGVVPDALPEPSAPARVGQERQSAA